MKKSLTEEQKIKQREYHRKWKQKHPGYSRAYYHLHREERLQYGKQWRTKNRERFRKIQERWKQNHPNARQEQLKKLKIDVISHYGKRCLCCGETIIEFLTIDHINRDGKKHRKEHGSHMYQWLRNNHYPQNLGLRVLCMNCNFATRHGESCPHQKQNPNKKEV